MLKSGNRYDLLEPSDTSAVETNRTTGLDNHGIVQLQRQIIREQDEDLDKLQESILNTKHLALAVNEELDLHAKLIDSFDQDVDDTESQLQISALDSLEQNGDSAISVQCLSKRNALDTTSPFLSGVGFWLAKTSNYFFLQRVQKKIGILNKRMKGSCTCKSLMMSVAAIVALVVISWNLIKYL